MKLANFVAQRRVSVARGELWHMGLGILKDTTPGRLGPRASMPTESRCGQPQRMRTLLALGIIGIPSEQAKRQYIRGWLRAANTGAATSSQHGSMLEHRFALGTKHLRGITHKALRREHAEQGDLALMKEQREGKEHLSEKTLRWFSHAAQLFPCAHFIGKADPDTLLVWERLGVQLRFLLSSRRALDRRLLVGTGFDWTSMVTSGADTPHACGCCGRSPQAAWNLRLAPRAAWGACDFSNRSSSREEMREKYASGGWSRKLGGSLEGPFPYAFGTFYAVSQPLVRWLAASPFVAHAIAQLAADRWSRWQLAQRGPRTCVDLDLDLPLALALTSTPALTLTLALAVRWRTLRTWSSAGRCRKLPTPRPSASTRDPSITSTRHAACRRAHYRLAHSKYAHPS